MASIKIYVCCHRPFPVPETPLLFPIQVGAALAESRFEGYLHDDTGDNISALNRQYCELTALYWAWKNDDADWYGLFHYRRYLLPARNRRRPYIMAGMPTDRLIRRLGFDDFAALVEPYDMIVPKSEEMYVSVREQYASAPFQRYSDLETLEQIIKEKYPEYVPAAEEYLGGTAHYFGNIAVMRREVFNDYCAWLFSILGEFDRRTDLSDRSVQELRVDGYLAERLLGVYYTKHRGELRTLELPRVHFEENAKKLLVKRVELLVLPAGSRLRAIVKKKLR